MARNDNAPPLPYSTSSALPQRQSMMARSGGTVKRSKTLTRPERHVAPVPLINPGQSGAQGAEADARGWWTYTSWVVTFWAPPALLRAIGIKDSLSQQAWREKITLVFIALVMGGFVGFFTMGLQSALCPANSNSPVLLWNSTSAAATLSIGGHAMNISEAETPEGVNFFDLSKQLPGQDITLLFKRKASDYPLCEGKTARYASTPLCPSAPSTTECVLGDLTEATLQSLRIANISRWEAYSWGHVVGLENFLVVDGLVLNMNPYINANPQPIPNDEVDEVIRNALHKQNTSGKDITRQLHNTKELKDAIGCLTSRYLAGRIDKITPGCFVASLFLWLSLIVILALILIRFFMAIVFSWFISHRLAQKPEKRKGAVISPTVMPEGANISVNNPHGTAPWAEGQNAAQMMTLETVGPELFTVCLVTCYSEGEEGIRGTLNSIAGTTFPDSRKLIWVVCDGMITGAGEKMSTPDICVSMLEADPRFGNPQPMGYIAVGSGAKAENRAMVYAGHYVTPNGHRVPTVMVVKCGMPSEATDKKPGNRGKRDSQLILMNFFSRVTYNDRMTPLDYDLFRKVHTLMGVTPDFFEVCLMVDADTVVFPESIGYLVNSMANDNLVMGVCGETRISNKGQTWITAIQVYEYFISHHNIKAFESVFGGVTCLPGCFSMYRIKARKDSDNDWVPILVKPEIVREYSQSEVTSLHQKNLLLLGEDRFLSTILLRTFPNRRNIFLPQARCRTVAPDTFKILLSQRRRWINSTIHNLMELVLVRDLCGTFCFSMQFVVFMDLVGTITLPVAICLTGALVINSILTPPGNFSEAIPLMLLGCVLGLPAVLIMLTTGKAIYVAWMLIYFTALPVWNFVLPVYSFWHFDDFSWGETRKVEGEVVDKAGHGGDEGAFEGITIPLRRWDDWERSRLRKIRREAKRRRQMEKMHGRGFYGEDELMAPDRGFARDYGSESDCGSVISSEEDVWGAEIGGYDEHNPSFPPPPTTLAPETGTRGAAGGHTLGVNEMAALLDQGFDEPPPAQTRPDRNAPSPLQRGYTPQPSSHNGSPPHNAQDGGYAALSRGSPTSSTGYAPSGYAQSTAVEKHVGNGHTRQRSSGGGQMLNSNNPGGNNYGPLGPLDDGGYKKM